MDYANSRFFHLKEKIDMDKISVIVSCYNEEEVLLMFHQEVNK